MEAYIKIVNKILKEGKRKSDRTGTGTIAVSGVLFEHDMSKGFPLLTTKSVPLRLVASELEFFIKGITDKEWLKERNNHIWDEWCSPDKIPYGHDLETKKKMAEERDLGPIYGFQWRNFNGDYNSWNAENGKNGFDQLKEIIKLLKKDPNSRRMICSAWNPIQQHKMALPPCHYCFQVIVIDGKLNLLWNQRSVDVALGLPFNIASYALLLHLLAKESGLKEGKLTGFLADTHIYENHIEGLKEQILRTPYPLPKIKTENFTSIFDWKYTDTIVKDYEKHPRIKFEVAI
jgi:thymidylate synthase